MGRAWGWLQRGGLRLLAAGAVGIVLVLSVIFPFVARAYASSSVRATPTGSLGETELGATSGEAVATSDGLGVLPLPLLSDQAFVTFQEDRLAAILGVGQRVFRDADAAFSEVSAWARSTSLSNEEDVNDLGVAREIVGNALVDNSSSEDDALTLSAYLLLESQDHSFDSNIPLNIAGAAELLGLALAEGAAEHFGTCDSRLAYAHARSLVRTRACLQ